MNWLRLVPLFRLVLPFSLGIVFSFYYPQPPTVFQKLLCLAFVPVLFLLHRFRGLHQNFNLRWVFGCVIFAFVFVCSYTYTNSRIEIFNPEHFSNYISDSHSTTLIGVISSEPEIKSKSIKATIRLQGAMEDGIWKPSTGNCLAYFQKSDSVSLRYGDEVVFNKNPVEISPPANFDEFNYKNYLSHHYVYHQIYLTAKDFTLVGYQPPNPLKEKAIFWRNTLLNRYEQFGISGENLAILSALTLGKKESLTDELKSAYSSAGAMHVLAVSGLHVGIIFLVLNSLLGWMEKFKNGNYFKALLLFISIWIYAFLTGLSPSVIRAATMFSFVILALNLNKKSNIYNTIALSALAIWLYRPFMLLEVGFQLSYLAVIGIIFFHPLLYNSISFRPWILDQAWNITCVSISAQLATAPLGLLYFHQFPTFFLLSNLIIIPAAFLIMALAIVFQATFFIPLLPIGLGWILNQIIGILNYSVQIIEQMPGSQIKEIDISILEVWLFYILLISIGIWITMANKKALISAILLITILGISQLWEKYAHINQREITFYSAGKNFAAEAVYGTSGIFVADSALAKDEKRMQFHVYHHWWKRGVNELVILDKPSKSSEIVLDNTKIFRLENYSGNLPISFADFEPDLLYFNAIKFDSILIKVVSEIHLQGIIAGPRTSFKTREQLARLCTSQSIPFHSIREDGALKIRLDSEGKPMRWVYPKTSEKE